MKWSLILILFALMQLYYLVKPEATTLRIDERVRILKEKLRSNLRNKKRAPEKDPLPTYYDSDDDSPIKPILEEEIVKDDDKFKLRKLKTKPNLKTQARSNNLATRKLPKISALQPLAQISQLKQQTKHGSFSLDIFYRKSFDLNTELEWMHCSELVTPYVKGVRDSRKWPKKFGVKDPILVRLLQLLSANTTNLGRAEKRSIMYQISKLKIRMYTWDISAMYTVLTKITKSRKADFASLKRGTKALFASWNTDLSNTSALLLQARVFRPPCFPRDDQGSSKFVRGSTIPVRTTKQRSSEEECMRRGIENC